MPKKKTKKELIESLPQNCFWVNNGPILSDLKELHLAMKGEITADQFNHHVSKGRNDFAAWVAGVLGDKKCANALNRAKKQDTAMRVLGDCLKDYKRTSNK